MIFAIPIAAMAMQLLRAVGTRIATSSMVRTAAQGVARSANARVAKSVAKRVAASATRSTAASATRATAAAVEAAGQTGSRRMAFDVLEDTTLTNARQVSAALEGETPTAAARPQTAAAVPPQAATPPAGATAEQAPAPQPKQQPAGGDSLLDRIADRMQRMRDHVAQKIYDRVPVSERVRGLTMDERFERLQQNNILKPMSEVAKEAATPNPSREQQVRSSEAAEEQARQERLNPKEQQEKEAGKSMLLRMGGMASGLGTIIAPHLPAEAIKIFAERISMANRHLEQWNASIASSYARLDMTRMRLDFQTASETSGSTSALNESLERLMEELQPFRAATITALNVVGKELTRLGIMIVQIVKWSPIFIMASKKLEEIEENTRKEHEMAQTPVADFMRRAMAGNYVKPLNPKPRDPDRPGRM